MRCAVSDLMDLAPLNKVQFCAVNHDILENFQDVSIFMYTISISFPPCLEAEFSSVDFDHKHNLSWRLWLLDVSLTTSFWLSSIQIMFSTDGYAFPETFYLGTLSCIKIKYTIHTSLYLFMLWSCYLSCMKFFFKTLHEPKKYDMTSATSFFVCKIFISSSGCQVAQQ